jgi:hypothetical protein
MLPLSVAKKAAPVEQAAKEATDQDATYDTVSFFSIDLQNSGGSVKS